MANTIITPAQPTQDDSSALSVIVSLILIVALALLFAVYGIPAIRNSMTTPTDNASINVNIPMPSVNTPNTQNPTQAPGTLPANIQN